MSRPEDHRPPVDPRAAIPAPVRIAGWIAAVQGLAGVGAAVYLFIRAVGGHQEETVEISGYGTAVWFAILGGGLLAAGVGLLIGKGWGRGLVVIAQLLLLFVAWNVVSSGLVLVGVALGVACAVALYSTFRREAVEWYAA